MGEEGGVVWEKNKVGGGEERCGERKGSGDRGKWKVEEKWEENKEEDEQEMRWRKDGHISFPSLSTSSFPSPPSSSLHLSFTNISNLHSLLSFLPTLTCVSKGALTDQTASRKFPN